MARMVELCVFGSGALQYDDGRQRHPLATQPKRLALLVYLALATARGYHRRDRLLGLFWPELDQSRARAALRKAVHGLRQALGIGVLISRGEDEVGLAVEGLRCDALEFEQAIENAQPARALEVYRADLLEGFFLPNGGEFEQWLEERRTHYRRQAATAAWVLAQRYESESEMTRAVESARKAATLAPLDERVVRKVIGMLDRVGDRAGAVTLYEHFRARLLDELGVEPAPETTELVSAVRNRRALQ
jgi:DNA-binding SARP family transcriptional activator